MNVSLANYNSKSMFVLATTKCMWFIQKQYNRPFTDLSANTIRVFVTFSIVNFVLPPVPAILPIALDK